MCCWGNWHRRSAARGSALDNREITEGQHKYDDDYRGQALNSWEYRISIKVNQRGFQDL